MTLQQMMQAKLAETGIPHKEIKVYGSQIMITAWSRDAAQKWASVLTKFAKVRRVWESVDYNQVNRGSMLNRTVHTVWMVAARI
jgi:hypothetical protein